MMLSAMPHHILGFGNKTRLLILIVISCNEKAWNIKIKESKEQNLLFTRWLFAISLTLHYVLSYRESTSDNEKYLDL